MKNKRVIDFESNQALDGMAEQALIEASYDIGDRGECQAYNDNGTWRYVRPSTAHRLAVCGVNVVTVWVTP